LRDDWNEMAIKVPTFKTFIRTGTLPRWDTQGTGASNKELSMYLSESIQN
jgi:hypothetical protein